MKVLKITVGGMIAKSIMERSNLQAQAYNTKKEFKYLGTCPDECWKSARVRVMLGVSEYKRLRACYDNYQDEKTLKADKQMESIVKKLRSSS